VHVRIILKHILRGNVDVSAGDNTEGRFRATANGFTMRVV
jgi:hypothetical protein